jgi:uncharacterized protein (DUF1778 family)
VARTKGERVDLRISAPDRELIQEAATVEGKSLSEFLTTSALMSARHVLADRREFVLPADRWDEFVAALEAPPKVNPDLAKLFRRPRKTKRG